MNILDRLLPQQVGLTPRDLLCFIFAHNSKQVFHHHHRKQSSGQGVLAWRIGGYIEN